MPAFCVNPFCLKKTEEMCNALSFLTNLWIIRGADDDLEYHIDSDFLNDSLVDSLYDKLAQQNRELAIVVSQKIIYPCYQDETLIDELCDNHFFWNGQELPEARMFYYAYKKSTVAFLYLILSFCKKKWDNERISFYTGTHNSPKFVDNLFYEKERHEAIVRRFFPKLELEKDSRFRKSTHKPVKGAVVYEEIETEYLWYKDTFHTGKSAHFEVFNSVGIHLGEASLDGALDRNKADKNKNGKI
ncbi:MAG: hypothetical protein IJM92_13235 [Fibrobacter sp.]|uniref:hypothetical protein n=1 Tax=Fibrobacter sp. TaxID=35828 RepID=UPI0025B8352A|nr:hypothetical protein [Fibrobacter sp.]MBQ7080589.1 hypothetical protein [Fibrobacter sp.]